MTSKRSWLRLLAPLVLVLVIAAACGEEEEPTPTGGPGEPEFTTIKEGVLLAASCLDYPPFEFVKDGEPTGFDVELTEEIADRMGLEVEWKKFNFDSLFTAGGVNQYDIGAAAITMTGKDGKKRSQTVAFSEPYFNSLQSLAVNVEETPDIKSTDDLGEGDVVGVQKGTTGESWAEENLVPNGVQLKTFESLPDAFSDLEAGNVTGIVNDEPSSAEEVEQRPGTEIVQKIDTNEKYGFSFSPENTELRDAVNEALQEIIDDGTYAELYDEYFGPAEVPEEYQPSA